MVQVGWALPELKQKHMTDMSKAGKKIPFNMKIMVEIKRLNIGYF